MPREPKVTLTLSESDARWLIKRIEDVPYMTRTTQDERIYGEVKHALADCECGEEPTR